MRNEEAAKGTEQYNRMKRGKRNEQPHEELCGNSGKPESGSCEGR